MLHNLPVRILTAVAGLACLASANAQNPVASPPAHAEAARVIERLEAERVKKNAPLTGAEAKPGQKAPAAKGQTQSTEALPEAVRAAFERAYELSWDALGVPGGDSNSLDALKINLTATEALLQTALDALPPLPRVQPAECVEPQADREPECSERPATPATDSATVPAPRDAAREMLKQWLDMDNPPQPAETAEAGPPGNAGLIARPFLQAVTEAVAMRSELTRLRADLKALRARVAALEQSAASMNPSK